MATHREELPDLTRTEARPATDGDGVRRQLGLRDPRDQPIEFELSHEDRHTATMTRLHLEKRRRAFDRQAASRAIQDAEAAADALARQARAEGLS